MFWLWLWRPTVCCAGINTNNILDFEFDCPLLCQEYWDYWDNRFTDWEE